MKRLRLAIAVSLALAPACTTEWTPAELGEGTTSQRLRRLEIGRETYATYCVGCHGENGDGAGPAAEFLDPTPRDFRVGRLKFAAVPSGEAPADADYGRVIESGLAGTAMPSFALLSEGERAALVAYIKTFRTEPEPPGPTIVIPADPFEGDAEAAIAVGRATFHGLAKCWSCHPAHATRNEIAGFHQAGNLPAPSFRPDMFQSLTTDSTWGRPLRAPDFWFDRVKTGLEVDNLVRIISAGVGGTAMPSWGSALSRDQLWGLAYYVRDLALMRGTPEATTLRAQLTQEKRP